MATAFPKSKRDRERAESRAMGQRALVLPPAGSLIASSRSSRTTASEAVARAGALSNCGRTPICMIV